MVKDEIYLSKMLKGENMGINSYEKSIRKLPDGEDKRNLNSFLDEHKRHKVRLESMLKARGSEPKNSVGITGKINEAISSTKLMLKSNPRSIIEDIYKGELMGINSSQKYFVEFSDSIKPDIEKIINEDKDRIDKIHNMLIKY